MVFLWPTSAAHSNTTTLAPYLPRPHSSLLTLTTCKNNLKKSDNAQEPGMGAPDLPATEVRWPSLQMFRTFLLRHFGETSSRHSGRVTLRQWWGSCLSKLYCRILSRNYGGVQKSRCPPMGADIWEVVVIEATSVRSCNLDA